MTNLLFYLEMYTNMLSKQRDKIVLINESKQILTNNNMILPL